jgi:sulfatase modifying factor 1
MNKFLLFGMFACCFWNIQAQFDFKKLNSSLVKIKPAFYVLNTEVTNEMYQQYLAETSLNSGLNTQALRVDSANWTQPGFLNEKYRMYYHVHPAYQLYPVVNVSHEQAIAFCDWLTIAYAKQKNQKFKKVIFRLPTEAEWEFAARGGDSLAIYPWHGNELRNKKGLYLANFPREINPSDSLAVDYVDFQDVTAPVKSYWANGFGLYCMSGNVAEMLVEKGKIKGGSWKGKKEDLKIDSTQLNAGNSQIDVGFRIVMVEVQK